MGPIAVTVLRLRHGRAILTYICLQGFFWAVVAIIPSAYVVYKITAPGQNGEPPYLTKKIQEYAHWQETWKERNALHTKAVEQAGFDRLLFFSTPANRDVDLRFPE